VSLRRAAVLLALAAAACARRAPEPPVAAAPAVEFTPIPESDELHKANPHDHQGKPLCQRCHAPGETQLAVDPIDLCATCHNPQHMKHPFGVMQPNPPPTLKLDGGTRIVCHTCHDPHDVKAHAHGLRLEYGDLCAQCHVRHGKKSGAVPH